MLFKQVESLLSAPRSRQEISAYIGKRLFPNTDIGMLSDLSAA